MRSLHRSKPKSNKPETSKSQDGFFFCDNVLLYSIFLDKDWVKKTIICLLTLFQLIFRKTLIIYKCCPTFYMKNNKRSNVCKVLTYVWCCTSGVHSKLFQYFPSKGSAGYLLQYSRVYIYI